jgi:hypothetical protein
MNVNHNQTVQPAPRPLRGLSMNHSETVLRAPRPPRGLYVTLPLSSCRTDCDPTTRANGVTGAC